MRGSMKENKIFESISSHEVNAPEHVMHSAIATAKRKRFLTFQWYSLNVWYVGLMLAAATTFFLKSHEEPNITASTSGNAITPSQTISTVSVLPAVEKLSVADSQSAPIIKASKTKKKKATPGPTETITTPVQTILPSTSMTVPIEQSAYEKASESVTESTVSTVEEKMPEKVEEVKVSSAKREKKKKIPVKVVQP